MSGLAIVLYMYVYIDTSIERGNSQHKTSTCSLLWHSLKGFCVSQAVLEGTALTALLLGATDLVCIVHLKDGVLAEANEAIQFLLVTSHLH